jgi:two-component system CheB/CheR fusion protein
MKERQTDTAEAAEQGTRATEACPVVVIGVGAGAKSALQGFFTHLPEKTGMSFILVLDGELVQDDDPHSFLTSICKLPIVEATSGLCLNADELLLVAREPFVVKRCKLEAAAAGTTGSRLDILFSSAAEDQEEQVIGILLSGDGHRGLSGFRAIKEHGGLTIVQSLETAQHEPMPREAIASGLVDHVLPAEAMPAKIVDYVQRLKTLQERSTQERLHQEASTYFPQIFSALKKKTGHDFSRYKQSTLLRRIQRRMQISGTSTLRGYAERIASNAEEADHLFKDLLISVTQFFRDPDAFRSLEKIIPDIFREKKEDEPVRVWVPGCATGEEAYTVAILMAEYKEASGSNTPVQIFGTDLDVEALEMARKARYPDSAIHEMTPDRAGRYFRKVGDQLELVESIREMCIFSPHNLIKDPPFSRLDLISCRNLLIYLELDLQRRLVPLFHYALRPAGFLFLGPSENVASRSELFRPIDKKQRIFQRKPTALRSRSSIPYIEPGRVTKAPATVAHAGVASFGKEQLVLRTIERVLLEDFAPASVIIDEQGDIVYFSGKTGRFLEPPTGAPSNKLVNMAKKGLRLELRTAVHRSLSSRQAVVRENILFKNGSDNIILKLVVRPLSELGRDPGLFIVVFQELPSATEADATAIPTGMLETDHPIFQQLEHELRTTREDLQTTIEELETSNEELKSANEELLSMNEELQSTNEELQTSKEELQSLNEELQHKVEELDAAHSDLQTLFDCTQVSVLFVDAEWRLRRLSPTGAELLGLAEADLGRPILELIPPLRAIQTRIQEGTECLESFIDYRNRSFLLRVQVHRPGEKPPHGLVFTFTDLTELRKAQEQRDQLAAIVDSSEDAIIGCDVKGLVRSWNRGAEKLFGYTAAEMLDKSIHSLVPSRLKPEADALHTRVLSGAMVQPLQTARLRKDRSIVHISLQLSVIRNPAGEIIGISSISRDISERKLAEEKLATHADQLERRVSEQTPAKS